jgi:hypothetical protein
MEVPTYPELSVKNMFADAVADPVLSKYLPSKEQLSGKLPERDFFFGILCTLKNQYMKDVIADAQKKRFVVEAGDEKKQGILISDTWFAELTKHPYYSSKTSALTHAEKPGTGIFLMKERAKLVKLPKKRVKHELSKKIADPAYQAEERKQSEPNPDKRLNLGKGLMNAAQQKPQGMVVDNIAGKSV